jgi:hypothetical protein
MELLDIEWGRCLDGYRLEQTKPLSAAEEAYFRKRPFIDRTYWNSSLIIQKSTRMERYRPLKNVLFAIFARWEASPAGMVRFCNAYGPLQATPEGVTLTPVDWMLDEQRILQRALRQLESGDPLKLIEQLDRGRYGACTFTLRPTATGTLSPTLIPESLGQAIYVQLALYSASGAKLWSCEQCGDPFYVGTGTNRRSTAKWCSNACKVAAYKNRQEGLRRGDAGRAKARL